MWGSLALALFGAGIQQGGVVQQCAYEFHGDVVSDQPCATIDRHGNIHFTEKTLKKLTYRHGLAAIHADRWYWVRRDGTSAPVITYDNWAADFEDGRAASPAGGKFGYIDRRLRLVIPARYDGVYPFVHGRAEVCIGCRLQYAGEHSFYVGGRWLCIDRWGRTIGREHLARDDEAPAAICPT